MSNQYSSLLKTYPKYWGIPVVLACSGGCLVAGLILPAITLKELIFWTNTFSVLTGIQSLFDEGHYFLGLVIMLFSIFFPIFKLIILSMVWFFELPSGKREFYVHWLGVLGKWSMLDVFVVAVTIVITKISGLAKANAEIGIYFFGISVALAMIVTERIERLIKIAERG